MIHITKKHVEAFGKMDTPAAKFSGYYAYRGKPMSGWLLFRFRFAFWRMKTFRLFKPPIINAASKAL